MSLFAIPDSSRAIVDQALHGIMKEFVKIPLAAQRVKVDMI